MQQRLHEINHRLTRRFTPRTSNLVTLFLFVTTPEVYKHHQHARFEDVRIDRERFGERLFRLFVIFRAAKTFEDAVHVTRTETIKRQRKVWIELDGALEMRNRLIAIVSRQSAKDETSKQIATAQVLLVGRRILRRCLTDSHLFSGTQLDSQTFDHSLCNRVLEHDDV